MSPLTLATPDPIPMPSTVAGAIYRHSVGLGLEGASDLAHERHSAVCEQPHPDADLLALCARLKTMQEEWQRLYDLTSEEPRITTQADRLWKDYSDDVWPGVMASGRDGAAAKDDIPRQIIGMRATTPEGRQAKAAAVAAIQDAVGYTDCRDDSVEMMESALLDCAAESRMQLGKGF